MPGLNSPENEFYRILEDLRPHLPELVLLGGWVPFVYARHVWKSETARIVATADVDFGVSGTTRPSAGKTVFETLSGQNYRERRLDSGRLWPVVFYKDGRIPVEFLADAASNLKRISSILGPQVHVNRLDRLDFLLRDRIVIRLPRGIGTVFCPRPSRYLAHKLMTFTEREDDFKKAKDLMYAYFILRYHPQMDGLSKEFRDFQAEDGFSLIGRNLDQYFSRLTGRGCLWVEKENGPDEFILDVRRDVFERFQGLKRRLS